MAAVPAALVVAAGGDQTALVGEEFAEPVVVQAADERGRPVGGVEVSWSLAVDGEPRPELIVAADERTSEDGRAAARIRAGERPAAYEVGASVPSARGSLAASAEIDVEAGAPAVVEPPRLDLLVAVGSEIRVFDRFGNPVPPIRLTFTSEDPTLVSVGRSGAVEGLLPGETWITVESDGAELIVPVKVWPPARFEAVAPGFVHTCGVDPDGEAYCWGSRGDARVGSDAQAETCDTTAWGEALPCNTVPVPVRGGLVFTAIGAGADHTCGLSPGGGLYCWGLGPAAGAGPAGAPNGPVEVAPGPFATLTVGYRHTCALAVSGEAYCWGTNSRGQLGDGTFDTRDRPTRVATDLRFVSLAAGSFFTCGVEIGGRAYCWGSVATLGGGDAGATENQPLPQQVAGTETYRSVVAGSQHVCGLTADGAAFCWGRRWQGQLGDGSLGGGFQNTPVAVASTARFRSITAGWQHTCGVDESAEAWCWGANRDGQLGILSISARTIPSKVVGDRRWRVLVAGGGSDPGGGVTCGITVQSGLFCWGSDSLGQLGIARGGEGSKHLRPGGVAPPGYGAQ